MGRREELLEEFGRDGETFCGMIVRYEHLARARLSGYSRCQVIEEFQVSKTTYYNWLDEFGLRR